jgi:hypothetical protein
MGISLNRLRHPDEDRILELTGAQAVCGIGTEHRDDEIGHLMIRGHLIWLYGHRG